MVKGVFRRVVLAMMAVAACAFPARASLDIQEMAKTMATAAGARRIKRVAIVPFTGPRGASSYSGAIVSERLVIQILARNEIDVVERRLLDKVLEEQRLGVFGIMDQDTVKTLGKVLGVDAILTGSIIELRNDRVEINARLINAETAQVMAADTTKMNKDWEDRPIGEDMSTWIVPVPELNDDLFKSGGGITCLSRVDDVERRLLDFKARYWAERLKDPAFTLRSLKRNPGSEIRDEDTRKQFFIKLRERYDAPVRTPLLPPEQAALAKGLEEVKVLTGLCGS
jgi:TolB-like protein